GLDEAGTCSEACWSCDRTAPSWISVCEERGGRDQLLLCPNQASHSPPPPDYWRGSDGQFSNPFCCTRHPWLGASNKARLAERNAILSIGTPSVHHAPRPRGRVAAAARAQQGERVWRCEPAHTRIGKGGYDLRARCPVGYC